MRKICWLLAVLVLLTQARPGEAGMGLVGTWSIVGTLVVESGDPRDPTRPKPGFQKPDQWKIAPAQTGLSLTSPAGTIYGMPTAQGAHFEGRYPMPVGGGMQGIVVIKIDCYQVSPTMLKATEEILYFMPNGLGQMQPVPLGREAWTAVGQRASH